MGKTTYSQGMRQNDAPVMERQWDVILWHVTHMGGWLHLGTGLLTLCKWADIVHSSWLVVFLPSLLYGALVVLLAELSEAFSFSHGAARFTLQTSRLRHSRKILFHQSQQTLQ